VGDSEGLSTYYVTDLDDYPKKVGDILSKMAQHEGV
jgi:hypothetical protein